jgi:hypothetical protein
MEAPHTVIRDKIVASKKKGLWMGSYAQKLVTV